MPTTFDSLIDKFAALHKVEAAVVRTIIQTESSFNPLALSRRAPSG
jgi:soluble lytic murein transglycosylase-like protein